MAPAMGSSTQSHATPFRLAARRCADYEPDRLAAALDDLLAPFGGLDRLVSPGQTVLLKPNLLSNRSPEAAATTHPLVVEIIAARLVRAGAKVFIGDSPPLALGRIAEYWKNSGLGEAAERSGAGLVSFESEPTRVVRLAGPRGPLELSVTERVFQADLVINLPKLKTHNLTVITGAVKNLYGLLPGLQKARLHRDLPRPAEFSRMIVGLAAALPPMLTIMDGILGMDGHGPVGGRPIRPGLLLASDHPVAVDLAFCAVAGLDPASIPTHRAAQEHGFGPGDLSQVGCHGDPLEELRIADFRIPRPSFTERLPAALLKLAQRLIVAHPHLIAKDCIGCGNCVRICPVGAARREEGSGLVRIARRRCISCFCCIEVCPKDAIVMRFSPLLEMFRKARDLKHRLRGDRGNRGDRR